MFFTQFSMACVVGTGFVVKVYRFTTNPGALLGNPHDSLGHCGGLDALERLLFAFVVVLLITLTHADTSLLKVHYS